jgi:hypothetical protein
MARTTRAINADEQRYMSKLKRNGWTDKQIAIHFGRDLKRTQAAIIDNDSLYRDVTKQESNPRYSTENDSGPKIRCKSCGNLATRVCKSDAKKCVACDMRGK